jgi:hypothetical protein
MNSNAKNTLRGYYILKRIYEKHGYKGVEAAVKELARQGAPLVAIYGTARKICMSFDQETAREEEIESFNRAYDKRMFA